MDVKIGDKLKLNNSKPNQIGEVIGILTDNVVYENVTGKKVIQAKKGEFLVKFTFHESENSFHITQNLN
jgi:hypothetical protein